LTGGFIVKGEGKKAQRLFGAMPTIGGKRAAHNIGVHVSRKGLLLSGHIWKNSRKSGKTDIILWGVQRRDQTRVTGDGRRILKRKPTGGAVSLVTS